jgi:hypothetical protein
MQEETITASSRYMLWRRVGRKLVHEPALLLSVAYLATSALGLWASYWFYRPFGIPIFDYMQPSDLLIAGLRDPAYLLLVALGSLAIWLKYRYDDFRFASPERLATLRSHWWGRALVVPRWRQHIEQRETPWWRQLLRLLSLPYLALMLVYIYVQSQAQYVASGKGTPIELTYAGDATPQVGHPLLLGTTAAWVFVYWPDQHRAEAVAQQSLRSLRYPKLPASPD